MSWSSFSYYYYFILTWLSCGSWAMSPTIVLYSGRNQTGESLILGPTYVSDLKEENMASSIESACVNGSWLLYDNPFYNANISGKVEYISGVSFCANLKTVRNQVSSLRFIGSGVDIQANTVTLYSNSFFQGHEEYFMESENEIDYLESVPGHFVSVIITGNRGWRIFEKVNFEGLSICINSQAFNGSVGHGIETDDEPTVRFVPNISEEFGYDGPVLSVRQADCF